MVDKDGRQAAVQLGIEDWRAMLDYLDDLADRALIKKVLSRLKKGPEKAGAVSWEEARQAW